MDEAEDLLDEEREEVEALIKGNCVEGLLRKYHEYNRQNNVGELQEVVKSYLRHRRDSIVLLFTSNRDEKKDVVYDAIEFYAEEFLENDARPILDKIAMTQDEMLLSHIKEVCTSSEQIRTIKKQHFQYAEDMLFEKSLGKEQVARLIEIMAHAMAEETWQVERIKDYLHRLKTLSLVELKTPSLVERLKEWLPALRIILDAWHFVRSKL